jgi:hypothetical protein
MDTFTYVTVCYWVWPHRDGGYGRVSVYEWTVSAACQVTPSDCNWLVPYPAMWLHIED